MSKVRRFSVCFVLALCSVMFLSGAVYADDDVYATTDMTWKEFFDAETVANLASLDAPVIPVASFDKISADLFANVSFDKNESGDFVITGIKAVPVKMSAAVLDVLSNDKAYTSIDETPKYYKELATSTERKFTGKWTNNASDIDGTGSKVEVFDGASNPNAKIGDYTVAVTNGNLISKDLFAAIVKVSGGNSYAVIPYVNFGKNANEIILAASEAFEGKEIRAIDFILLQKRVNIHDLEGKKLKKQTTAKVVTSGDVNPGTDVPVTLVGERGDIPKDESVVYKFLSASVLSDDKYTWEPLTSGDDFKYEEDVSHDFATFTFNGTTVSGDQFKLIFRDSDDVYVDIKGEFTVGAKDTPESTDVSPDKSGDKPVTTGGDSSGCDAGLGIFGLAALVGLIGYMKRK